MVNFNINFTLQNKKNNITDYEQKELEYFISFLKKVENDLNNCLLIFLKANGKSYKELKKSGEDLDKLFEKNNDYKDFVKVYNKAKNEIDKILYIEEYDSYAKKKITENVFLVKNFISTTYPNVKTDEKINFSNDLVFKIVLIILLLSVFLFLINHFNS